MSEILIYGYAISCNAGLTISRSGHWGHLYILLLRCKFHHACKIIICGKYCQDACNTNTSPIRARRFPIKLTKVRAVPPSVDDHYMWQILPRCLPHQYYPMGPNTCQKVCYQADSYPPKSGRKNPSFSAGRTAPILLLLIESRHKKDSCDRLPSSTQVEGQYMLSCLTLSWMRRNCTHLRNYL